MLSIITLNNCFYLHILDLINKSLNVNNTIEKFHSIISKLCYFQQNKCKQFMWNLLILLKKNTHHRCGE